MANGLSTLLSMAVAVMQIRIVNVAVFERRVFMLVGMGLGYIALVRVLVMLVMNMGVFVFQFFVLVIMLMAFGQVQPSPKGHQQASHKDAGGERCSKKDGRKDGTDERGGSIVSAGSCRAQIAQGENEKHQTQTITHKAQHHSAGD